MPIYQLLCPDCGHHFKGMVFAGSREPELWICSQCGSNKPKPNNAHPPIPHPLEAEHGVGCPCCGSADLTEK